MSDDDRLDTEFGASAAPHGSSEAKEGTGFEGAAGARAQQQPGQKEVLGRIVTFVCQEKQQAKAIKLALQKRYLLLLDTSSLQKKTEKYSL